MLTEKIIKEATEIIENLKKLPKDKQDYLNGYVQGVVDTLSDNKKPA